MINPYVFDDKAKEQFIELLWSGNSITSAAEALNVGRRTIYRHRHDDPKFDEAVVKAMRGRIEIVEDALYMSALQGNVTAQIFYLVNRTRHLKDQRDKRGEKWISVNRMEVSGPDGRDLNVVFMAPEVVEDPEAWEKHAAKVMKDREKEKDEDADEDGD